MITRNSLITNWDDRRWFLTRLYSRWEQLGGSVDAITEQVKFELWRDRVAQ